MGAEWVVTHFPDKKSAREFMIAEMFVRAANEFVMGERPGQPAYRPFCNLVQNEESDLDVSITTSRGVKRMELAEFAPLDKHGPHFENAPRQLDQVAKAELMLELVRKKSKHHGGPNRLLLIYVTEHCFKVDPIAIEIMRRRLVQEPPRFERVYYVSPHGEKTGSVSEIFPGKPHHIFGDWGGQQLRRPAFMPHPTEFLEVWEGVVTMTILFYGECVVKTRHRRPVGLRT
jgi:hypothetical protein